MPSVDNKRIAKNTLYLYVRMILTIVVNLYAVRVIWRTLGIEDYGVYNVVGGIVLMFAFINNAMVASSQRFISFELGTGDKERLGKVFGMSLAVHFMLALLVLVIAETAGLWLLNARLNIPSGRMVAANWVYQCAVAAFIVNIVSVPYNACIVAHEHMKAFGYFGILETVLKLAVVFLLVLIPFDKLIVYAVLVLAVSGLMRLIYGCYCRRNFGECHCRSVSDRRMMRDMFSFAGWSFIGNLGFSARDQGLNIVVNLFFNVAVNAAKGIATQVDGVIRGFAGNFQMALGPQIVKRFAAGETDSMMDLVFTGCKYSALLLMFVVIPLYFASETVLGLWLGDVAPYTAGFMRLALLISLVDSMVNPIVTALHATGRIKWFQIIISIIMVANIPMAWIWLKFDADPYIVLYVSVITSAIALVTRLILLHHEISFPYRGFLVKVICRAVPVLLLSGACAWRLYPYFDRSMAGLVYFSIVSVAITGTMAFMIGLETSERRALIATVIDRVKRI